MKNFMPRLRPLSHWTVQVNDPEIEPELRQVQLLWVDVAAPQIYRGVLHENSRQYVSRTKQTRLR